MIIYFSGTGNSRDVATRLSSLLGDDDVVELCGKVLKEEVLQAKQPCKSVIWVFPVYSWGVPPVVAGFIKSAKISGITVAAHHLVATCGDDAGLTAKKWRKLMHRRGWTAASASTVIMPNTYTLMKGFDVDPDDVAQAKLEASQARVKEIARRIKEGDTADDDVVTGRFAWFKSCVIYPLFCRFTMSAKPFHATSDCTGCGLCARSCPLDNITVGDDRRPAWGNDCAQCLRCYHTCPVAAVQYGKATQGKGRYLNKTAIATTAKSHPESNK